MKKRHAAGSVHALEVPTHTLPLLLPSACIAEVVPLATLTPISQSPPWVMGALNWRSQTVPVFSYDVLAGSEAHAPGPRARVIVLYPLPGRGSGDFIGLLADSEPQSREVDAGIASVAVGDSYPAIAAGLRFNDRLVGIPDFAALAAILYPR